jgi:hypothetical protein
VAKTHFLNVDLELTSEQSLRPILTEVEKLGGKVDVLKQVKAGELNHLSLEVWPGSVSHNSADRTINAICRVVESLGEKGRVAWDRCRSRVFNIGYESGDRPSAYESALKTATIERVSRLKGSITVTIYRTDETPPNKRRQPTTGPSARVG